MLLATFVLCLGTMAQQRVVQNKPFIDERKWHYGFHIGFHDQSLKLINNGFIDPKTGAQWMAENDRQNFGFSVGVLGDWRITRQVALRVSPGLHFGSKHIAFRNQVNGELRSQDLKSTFVSLPLDIKVAAPRFNNYRPYVVGGFSAMYDMTSGKGEMLRTQPLQTFVQIGLGCDFYLPFFKLNPELKFYFGLGNVLRHDRPDLTAPEQYVFTQSLSKAIPGMVVLTFYFE
jgi:porT protein